MPFMIMCILDNADQVPVVLKAWEDLNAPGITVFNSLGINRLRRAGFRDDLPLIPSLRELLHTDETLAHQTLVLIVEDEAAVERYVEAAQAIVGDFDDPNTGILCVMPLVKVYGLGRMNTDNSER